MEQWKQIEGFGYAVSNFGRMFNTTTEKSLSPHHNQGKARVTLYVNGRTHRKHFYLASLVYNYFIERIPKGVHIGFKDNNPFNCTADNLYLTAGRNKTPKKAHHQKEIKEKQMDSVLFEGGSSVSELDLYCTVRATSYRNYYIRQSPFN